MASLASREPRLLQPLQSRQRRAIQGTLLTNNKNTFRKKATAHPRLKRPKHNLQTLFIRKDDQSVSSGGAATLKGMMLALRSPPLWSLIVSSRGKCATFVLVAQTSCAPKTSRTHAFSLIPPPSCFSSSHPPHFSSVTSHSH